MSAGNVVDSRVVELSFDNKDFESNAKTSMSTLEKLKRALNFKSESKGFDDVGSSIKRINIDGLTAGVLGLKRSFGEIAKDVFIFRTLSNLIDSAERSLVNFGKTLTVGQVQSGWGKYAEKTSAVQTIMAATAKDFSDTAEQMEVVNQQLTKLNWFTDETSYSFIDMVSNIGKFTSNNVSLEDSVTAMEGISTWAAISGANVQNASHAMYNLSQAIATGSVKLMDWKSIENANMATAEFKETALETAASLGTLTKAADGTFKTLAGHEVSVTNFNQQLSDGWFTSQVLLDTLDKYGTFTEKLYEVMDSIEGDITTSTMLEWIESFKAGELDISKAAKEAEMSAEDLKKVLTELGDESLEFGMKAFKAAQEAKTFEEAIEATKDAVSTGWMNTFEIIFGDYTQAKKLWTTLANDMWEVFAAGGEKRNNLLREAFDTSTGITEEEWSKITQTGIASPAYIRAVRESAAEHGQAIDDMVTDEQWLEVALQRGYIKMSDLNNAYSALGKSSGNVDEALKSQVESAKEADEEFAALLSTLEQYGEGTIENVIFGNGQLEAGYEDLEHSMDAVIKKLGLSQEDGQRLVDVLRSLGYFGGETTKSFYEMSNSELIALGYTEEQVKQIRLAQREGIAFEDIMERILHENHKTTGELWTETLFNGMEALVQFAGVLGETWNNVFPDVTSSNIVAFVDTLHSGSEQLLDFIENSEELRTILTGVFSVLDLGFGVIRTIGKSGFAIINGVLEGFGINLLEVASNLASFVTSIHDWVMENQVLEKVTTFVGTTAKNAASTVKGWLTAFKNIPLVNKNLTRFKLAFQTAFKNFGPYMSEGATRLQEFFGRVSKMDGLSIDNIKAAFTDFKENILGYFAKFPGFQALKNAILYLWADIKAWLEGMGVDVDGILEKFQSFGEGVKVAFGYVGTAAKAAWEFVTNLFSSIANSKFFQTNIQRFKDGFVSLFDKIGPFLSGGKEKIDEFIAKVKEMGGVKLDNLGDIFSAFKETVLSYFQNFDGFEGIKEAFSGLRDDIKAKLSDMGLDVDGIQKKISDFVEKVKAKIEQLRDFLGFGKKDNGPKGNVRSDPMSPFGMTETGLDQSVDTIETFGDKLLKVFGVIGDVISGIDLKTLLGIGGILIALKAMKDVVTLVTSITATINAAKGALKGAKYMFFALAILAIAGAVKLLAELSEDQIDKGLATAAGIMFALWAFAAMITKFGGGKKLDKAGDGVLKIAGAVIIMVGAIWLINQVLDSIGDAKKIGRDIGILIVLMAALGTLTYLMAKFAGKDAQAAGIGMLAIAGSLLLMIAVLKILDGLDIENPLKVVTYLAVLIVTLVGTIFLVNTLGGGPTGNYASAAVIASLALGLLIIAGALKVIASIDVASLDRAVDTLMIMSVCLAGVIFVAGKLSDTSVADIFMVIAVAAAIGVLAIALAALSMIDGDKLKNVAICLGGVMVALAALAGIVGGLKPSLLAMGMLIALLAAVGAALYLLTTLTNPDKVLKVAASLALVLVALSVSLLILQAIGQSGVQGLISAGIGVAALIVFIGIFALLGFALSKLKSGVKDKIIEGLGTLNDICAAIGEVFVTIAEYVGRAMAAFLGGGIEEGFSHLGKIGQYLAEFNESLQGVKSLSFDTILGVLETVVLVFLVSLVGFLDELLSTLSRAQTGKSAAEQFADDLKELGLALLMWHAAMSVVEGLSFDDILAVLEALVAVFLASLVGFFDELLSTLTRSRTGMSAVEQMASDLDRLGLALVAWHTSMMLVEGMSFDDIAAVLEALTLVFLASLVGFFDEALSTLTRAQTGRSAAEQLAEDLQALATALLEWQKAMEQIDEITIPDSLGDLAASILQISFTGLIDACTSGISQAITGKRSVELFCEDIENLAGALSTWQTKMESIGEITVPTDAISKLVGAIEDASFSSLMSSILTFVGNFLTGDDKTAIEDFKQNVTDLATALTTWQTKMDEAGTITVPEDAIQKIVDAINMVEPQDLWDVMKDFFDGDTIENFKNKAGDLGTALTNFSNALGTEIDIEKTQTMADAAKTIAEIPGALKGNSYEEATTWATSFVDNLLPELIKVSETQLDLDNLTGISTAAKLLADASEIFTTIELDSASITDEALVDKLKSNVGKLKFMIEALVGLDTSGVDSFTDSLTKINGVDISSTMDKMSEAVANADMSASGSAMAESMAKGLGSSTALGTAANDAAEAAANAIKTDSFQAQGVKLMSAMATGISIASGTFSNAVKTVISTAASNAGGYSQQFNNAGYNFAQGLANGMARGLIMAMAAARALAQSVLNAVKNTLQERSPSKAAEDMGVFFDLGLINGLRKLAHRVGVAGSDVGESAKNGLASAIKSINSVIHDDIDGEPVIRPVLDLTNIQNGTSLLTDMLSFNDPIGVVGSLNAINSNLGMRSRSTNDDILAALNDLGRTIGSGRPGDTYNINGITYDDGSNVSDAVKSLIRATRVERRS